MSINLFDFNKRIFDAGRLGQHVVWSYARFDCHNENAATMNFTGFPIQGPMLAEPRCISDARGYFVESFKAKLFNEAVGSPVIFVQENQSFSLESGTVRGLHYQAPPYAQGKLVSVMQGAVIDIAVDVRKGSPTYGQHVRVELCAKNRRQFWVPEGFLHGFATLEPNTLVMYKITNVYAPDYEGSVAFDDPDLGLDWGFEQTRLNRAILSDKDAKAPRFADWESPFEFETAIS